MLRQSETQVAQKSPRIPRWGRRGLALLVAVGVLSSLFCLPASAATVVTYPFAQPTVTDNWGYVEALHSNGRVDVYIFNVQSTRSGYGDLVKGSDLEFYYDSSKRQVGFKYLVNEGTGTFGNAFVQAWLVYPTGYYDSFWYQAEHWDCRKTRSDYGGIVAAHVYGCRNGSGLSSSSFTVSYGSDSVAISKLDEIISRLQNSAQQTETAVDNANKKAEEREKQETQTSGDNATNDTTSAMPSVDAGFSNSLKGFVRAMSYDGTQALLPIPKTSIPALAGVTDEITLISAQDYDLSAAINQYIPETLLQLIRHLFTIALVLYCVYELYGLIQYVLTLKKGGKDE